MALERLFAHFKEGGPRVGGYDPADPASYESFIQAIISDSRGYEEDTLAPARDTAQKYYYGYLPSLNPDGSPYTDNQIVQDPNATFEQILGYDKESAHKSTYVSTDVRDAVMLTLPSLIRLFAASENVVNLVPRTEADVDAADQQTNYINYVFWQDNPGFLILHGAFKDALTVRTGFVKWWTDDHKEKRRKSFVNLSGPQVQMLQSQDPTARLVHVGQQDPQTGSYDEVVFEYQVDKPAIRVMGVPPEEMRLDRYARSFSTSRIVGHERIVPIDELTAMGYDREQCLDYLQSQEIDNFTMESQLRNPGRSMSTGVGDGVLYGEWYIKVDRDGDGVAELRYICTMGEDHKIVHDKEANRVKFAVFGCDPISHTIVGDSLADYVQDVQKFKTNMMRGVLDSLAESINPKSAINELVVDMDDAMNDDVGGIIRVRGNPGDAISYVTTPFAGQQALPVIELMNDVLQRRTGMSDAAKGLDPKQLQSSTQIGVEAIINGQQERTELIARVLAETGFKDLFEGLYNEIAESPNQRRTLRVNGKWTPIDTSTFDASMGVEVNSTLGKGSDTVRFQTLLQIKQTQELIMQQFGTSNPVVGVPQYLNTITDMLALSNIKNVGRYFQTPPPQVLQQIAASPKEPDAMTVAAKAQYEKVKSETAQAIGDLQIRQEKQKRDDAFRREQLRQKADYEQQKLEIERAKVFVGASPAGPTAVDPIEAAKIGVDIHTAHLDAAMADQDMRMKFATDQAKIAQQREAAQLQAETAQAAAQQSQQDGDGQ
jgi:hypothetical protein